VDHAYRQVRIADVDIDDLSIYAGALVYELDLFRCDVGGAFRVLRQAGGWDHDDDEGAE
jgi:hypothetical protein